METNKTDRIKWIDSCKGFAIMLVVVGHVVDSYLRSGLFLDCSLIVGYIHSFIYSFHMPLFFSLSGILFYLTYLKRRDQKTRSFVLKIMNNIYIYILWSCIQWFTKFIFVSTVNEKLTVNDLLLIPIKPMTPYWYLYVMIFYYIIFYCYEKININEIFKFLIILFFSMVGSCINIDIIFPLITILRYSVFFYLGICIIKFSEIIATSRKLFVMCSAVSFISIWYIITFNTNILQIKVIGIVSAACISMLIIYLFSNIDFLKKAKILNLCGQYSLEIYVTHCFIIAANRILLLKLGITNFYVNVAVNFIMSTFIPVICAAFMKKIGIHKAIFRPTSYLLNKGA